MREEVYRECDELVLVVSLPPIPPALGVHLDTNGTFGGVLESQLFQLELVKS